MDNFQKWAKEQYDLNKNLQQKTFKEKLILKKQLAKFKNVTVYQCYTCETIFHCWYCYQDNDLCI
ncbi:MAG: hypothetical protein OHM56_02935 [Spiroplasma phoeniceum]|nr:MAG: hypothetical protein OHM56_02935 [Spiroplasma phoeniceum]